MENLATKMCDNAQQEPTSQHIWRWLYATAPIFSYFAAKLLNQQKSLVLKAAPSRLYFRLSVTWQDKKAGSR